MKLVTITHESRTLTMPELQKELNTKIPATQAAQLWKTGSAELSREGKLIKWLLIMEEEKGAK